MTFEDYWSAVDSQPTHIPGTVPPPGVTGTRTDLLSRYSDQLRGFGNTLRNSYNRLGLGGAPQGSGPRFGEPMPGEATVGPDLQREMASVRNAFPLPPGITNAIRSIAPGYTPDNTNLRAAPDPMASGISTMSAPPPPWNGLGISNDEMNRRFPGLNLPPSNPAPNETMAPTPMDQYQGGYAGFPRQIPSPPRMNTWGDYFQRLNTPDPGMRQQIEQELLQDQLKERQLEEQRWNGPSAF